jgi:hypothetical protein
MYIIGILSIIVYVAINDHYEIIKTILVLMITYFIKYFEPLKFQLLFLILAISSYIFFTFLLDFFLNLINFEINPINIDLINLLLLLIPGIGILIFFLCFVICSHLIKIIFNEQKTKPKLTFLVPFPSYVTYPKDYNFLKELLIKPQSSSFSQMQNNDLYKTWNGEAIINFKWRVFGRYYYAGIWILFIIYLTCFTLASIPYDIFNEEDRKYLFFFSIILGFIHLLFEVRQFIWSPTKWISDIWNLFGN